MSKITSQGFVLTQFGNAESAFHLQELDLECNDNQLIVEVSSFGLNYADIMARNGKYRETPPLPTTIGYEVVGKVVQVGENLNSDLVGKRILAFSHFGGYAKHAVIEKEAFIEVDEKIPGGDALALCTQYVTAYFMTNYQSKIYPEDIVLVHAATGGVGSGLIQMCKNNGATVIAKVGQTDKIERAKELGADFCVNYHQEDYETAINKFLSEKRLTYSFNPAGGETFKKDLRLIGSGGKLVLFGGSSLSGSKWGFLSQLNFVRKMGFVIPVFWMMKSKSFLGVNMLATAQNHPLILQKCMKEVYQLYQEGKLKAFVDHTYSSSQLPEAHQRLESGKSMGKIVVKW